MKEYRTLETIGLGHITAIQQPADTGDIDLDSLAFEVFTDFRLQQPFMLEQSVGIEQAREMMQREHVRRKLVIDVDEHLRGVISLKDLVSSRVMQVMEATNLKREDLTVGDVMVRTTSLKAVELKDFEHARIGDILMTMKAFGEEHVLVVDTENQALRGMVSSTDIARKLHQRVSIDERATSFSEIYQTVRA